MLTNSLLYFKNNIIKFRKVDIFNDIIEISFILISDKIKRCKPLLLDLKSLEINKYIKKLLEMPDKSFIDISYIIKEEINDQNNLTQYNSNEKLELKKYYSNNIELNNNNKFNPKIYNTPQIVPKVSNFWPVKLDLNSNIEIEENNLNFAQKIFKKIIGDNNSNNSFKIIYHSEKQKSSEYVDYNNGLIKDNNFCFCIFISGLKSPIDDSSFLDNSKNFISSCIHKNCSNLTSLKPEILSKFFNKNNESYNELNYLVANLCFPLGIKICLENITNKINKKSNKIYYNVIKNSKDDIFYITTLQYFIKMNYESFKKKYRYDLISYYNKQDKKESFLKNITNESLLYIPESISLLSKYPFFVPMNICLNVLLSLNTSYEKNCLINHIINEIPLPKRLTQILFYIPIIKNPIILNHEYNLYKGISSIKEEEKENNNKTEIYGNISMSQFNSMILINKISIENIIFLFQLLLLEQQIILVENDYEILSKIIIILKSLIYPLKWINPFLPILSFNTVQFLQTPVPYIMGIDEYLLKYALNSKNIYFGKEIIIYNISSKTFTMNKTKKKINKKEIMDILKLNKMPEKINNFLLSELKKKEIIIEKKKNIINENEMDMEIRLIFLKAMLLFLGDYNNYIFYTDDDNMALFNKEAFIESHKDKDMKLFLEQMLKTQLFKQFLQNEKLIYLSEKNINKNKKKSLEKDELCLDNNYEQNNYFDTSYFKKLIEKYPEFINNYKERKSSFDFDYKVKDSNFGLNFDKNKNSSILRFKFNSKKEINKKIENSLNSKEKNNNILIDLDNLNDNPFKLNKTIKSQNFDEIKNNKFHNLEINKQGLNNNSPNEYNNIIIRKKNRIKKYFLFPYFIKQNKEKSLKYNIIYEKILDYNKKNKYELFDINTIKNRIYIFPPNKLEIESTEIDNLSINDYIFESNNNKLEDNTKKENKTDINLNKEKNIIENKNEMIKKLSEIDEIKNDVHNIYSNIFNPSEEHYQNNIQYNYKENFNLIKDCFTLCLTNKSRITKNHFSSLEVIFSDKYNRKYFSELIFPDIKIKYQHKEMMELAFNDFVDIIKICLLKIKEDEYQIGRIITLACFSYYKIKEGKNIYIYQNINNKNEYKIWNIDLFWIEFFKIEIKESKNNEEMMLKNLDNDKSLIEFKSKFTILMDISIYISKIMIKLNLKKDFIIKIFEKMILPVYEFDYDNINNIIKKIKQIF